MTRLLILIGLFGLLYAYLSCGAKVELSCVTNGGVVTWSILAYSGLGLLYLIASRLHIIRSRFTYKVRAAKSHFAVFLFIVLGLGALFYVFGQHSSELASVYQTLSTFTKSFAK